MSEPAPPTIRLADADRLGWPSMSVAESRRVDQTAIERYHVPGIDLMRVAGRACAQRLLDVRPVETPPIGILCGAGNNGGDGYVIAQHLHDAQQEVVVWSLVDLARLRGDARISAYEALANGVAIVPLTDTASIESAVRSHNGPIVDCLLGTGAKGDPREPMATAIRAANQSSSAASGSAWRSWPQRIAIDVPSGLDGDTGQASEPTFVADLTLTFVAPKTGFRFPAAERFLGSIEIVDIGLPAELKRELGLPDHQSRSTGI